MPINEAQQGQLSARVGKLYAQDKKIPMLINIHDGRLIANSIAIRGDGTPAHPANPDYRPYTGSLKATLAERMAFISSSIGGSRTRLINSEPDEEPKTFDLGKATKDEIITFAFSEFGLVLDEGTDIRTLRKQVMAVSEKASAVGSEALG
jgi:hypothetical protein